MSDGAILLITGALLAGGLAASLLAGRLRVPGLVLVLGLGMAIGSEGLGWISFDDYTLARRIGIVALSLILFEGGLAAGWGDIRPVFGAAMSLAVVGTVVTGVIAGGAARRPRRLAQLCCASPPASSRSIRRRPLSVPPSPRLATLRP